MLAKRKSTTSGNQRLKGRSLKRSIKAASGPSKATRSKRSALSKVKKTVISGVGTRSSRAFGKSTKGIRANATSGRKPASYYGVIGRTASKKRKPRGK